MAMVPKLPDGSCPPGSNLVAAAMTGISQYGEYYCDVPMMAPPPVMPNPPPGCAPGFHSEQNTMGGSAEFICVPDVPPMMPPRVIPTLQTPTVPIMGNGDQNAPMVTGTGDQTPTQQNCAPGFVSMPGQGGGFVCVPEIPRNRMNMGNGDQSIPTVTGTGDQTPGMPPPVTPLPVTPILVAPPPPTVMPSPVTRTLPTLTPTPTPSSKCDCLPVANPYQAQTNELVRFPAVGGTMAYGPYAQYAGYAPAPAARALYRPSGRPAYVSVRAAAQPLLPTSPTFSNVAQWAAFAVAGFIGYKTVQRMYG